MRPARVRTTGLVPIQAGREDDGERNEDRQMSKRTNRPISESAEFIFRSLKADISLGRLHPRERLVEAELVERFKSHRPAVREALGMLAQLGLVVHIPNKGASVAELSLDELTKIYEMRIELECLAASWIPLPMPQASFDELAQILREHSDAIDNMRYREIFRLDELFHNRLNAHCGNPHLQEMIELMSDRGMTARFSAEMTPEFLNGVRDEHMQILDAIRTCDRERLVSTMRAHNVRGIDWFAKSIREREARAGELSRDEAA